MNLLVLDASPRVGRSRSRTLSQLFIRVWTQKFKNDQVILRDLSADNTLHLTENWMQAAYTPPEKRSEEMRHLLSQSDTFVSELLSADYLLISTPMYNFSIPSCLKAYIDQVFRLGETFRLKNGHYEGLVSGKKAFVICTKGGFYSEEGNTATDFASPYLSHIARTLGFPEVEVFDAEGLDISKEHEEKALAEVTLKIDQNLCEIQGSRND